MKIARLVLEDGSIFYGENFGFRAATSGEVVFNTSMTGYQEVITDPSYRGQIVTLTYPLIGNYGHIDFDSESRHPQIRGLIVKQICHKPSNWRSEFSLAEYLQHHEIVAITGIDTRELTKKIRQYGTMRGLITSEDLSDEELRQQVMNVPPLSGSDLVSQVTVAAPYTQGHGNKRVVLIDCGAKRNIIRSLVKRGCQVVVVPALTSTEDILSYKPHGILISNGPGDPEDVPIVIENVRKLLGVKPIFGICLGHQVLGLACGAKTYKLKFGHRGSNHPVKDLTNNRVHITAQNHGFAVSEESLVGTGLEVTHLNLTDQTVEGFRHTTYPAFSVQYHPEASPGPEDSHYLFDRFVAMLDQ